MSRTVESKVVEMKFDNSNFEKNVKTSIGTLDKLKDNLKMSGVKDSISDIGKSANGLDFSGLLMATQTITNKFSIMEEIAVGALRRMGQQAYDTGVRLVKGMSIDQVTAGWTKYEQKTQNVQTLMNSTGKSIDEVNGYLQSLMWYSDETSFGFTDMTSALSTMVSSGGDIEKLIPMIMGMGNATAYAGKGANEFQRVIYNLNQSYSQGFLSTMDWRSVENAGAASIQLKEYLIEAAEELGTIQKGTGNVTEWANYLSGKKITSEAMEIAFNRFAEYTNAVKEAVDNGTYETATQAMQEMGSEGFNDVAVKAFKSAQQAKSFADAIDATKDAVSSGWMSIFETIFGDIEQSTELWTDFCNDLWDIFASGFEGKLDFMSTLMQSNPFEQFTEHLEETGFKTDELFDTLKGIEHEGVLSELFSINNVKDFDEAMQKGLISISDIDTALSETITKAVNSNRDMSKLVEEAGAAAEKVNGSSIESFNKVFELYQKYGADSEKYKKELASLGNDNVDDIRALNDIIVKTGKSLDDFSKFSKKNAESFGVSKKAMEDLFINYQKYGESSEVYKKKLDEIAKGDKQRYEELNTSIIDAARSMGFYTDKEIKNMVEFRKEINDTSSDLYELYGVEREFDDDGNVITGRTYLINVFSNALHGLMSVLELVKEAWRNVFPAKTTTQAYKLLQTLSHMSEKLIPTEEQAEKLSTLFEGLFSILGIFKDALKVAFGLLKSIFGILPKGNKSILDIAASFGEWLTNLRATIQESQLFEKIANVIFVAVSKIISVITKLVAKMKEFISAIKETEAFNKFVSTLQAFGNRVKEIFSELANVETLNHFVAKLKELSSGVLSKIATLFVTLAGRIKDFISVFKEANGEVGSSIFGKFANVLGTIISKIWELAKLLGGGVLTAIKTFGSALFNAIKNLNFADASNIIGDVLGAGIIVGITKFIKQIKGILSTGDSLVGALIGDLESISNAVDSLALDVKADALKKIAEAILMLSFSLILLSGVEYENLAKGIGAITTLLGELVGAFAAMSKISSNGLSEATGIKTILASFSDSANMVAASKAMKNVAEAVLILAASLFVISKIDSAKLEDSLFAVTILLAELTGVAIILSKYSGKMTNGTKGMVKMAVSILILGAALKVIASIEPDRLASSLKAITLLFVTLTASLLLISKKGSKAKKAGEAIKSMAVALLIMSAAVSVFSKMDPEKMGNGLIGVAISMGILTAAALSLNKIKGQIDKAALAMILMSVALTVMAAAVKLFGMMDPNQLIQGLGAVAVIIGGFVIAAKEASESVGGMLALSGSLIMLSIALALLTPELMIIGANSLTIAKGLVVLAAALAIMIIAAAPAEKLSKGLLVLTGALVGFGIACLAVGVGVMALAMAFGMMSVMGAVGAAGVITFLEVLISGIIELIPFLISAIGIGISSIIKTLTDLIPTVLQFVSTLIVSVCDMIIKLAPKLMETLAVLLTALLAFLVEMIPEVVTAGIKLVTGLIEGITEAMPDLVDAAFNMIITFINSLATAIEEHWEELFDAVVNLLKSLWTAVKGMLEKAITKVWNLAKRIAGGLIQGIKDKMADIWNKAVEIVTNIKNGIKSGFDKIKSVAKEMVDKFIDAVKALLSKVKEIGLKLAKWFWEGFKSFVTPTLSIDYDELAAQKKIQDMQKEGLSQAEMIDKLKKELNIVEKDVKSISADKITPSLDLSGVSSSVNAINSMFSAYPIGVNGKLVVSDENSAMTKAMNDMCDATRENTEEIVRALNDNGNTNVNVTLEGDSNKFFKAMQYENKKYKRTTGVSGFA